MRHLNLNSFTYRTTRTPLCASTRRRYINNGTLHAGRGTDNQAAQRQVSATLVKKPNDRQTKSAKASPSSAHSQSFFDSRQLLSSACRNLSSMTTNGSCLTCVFMFMADRKGKKRQLCNKYKHPRVESAARV